MITGTIAAFCFILLFASAIFLFTYAAKSLPAIFITIFEIVCGSIICFTWLLLRDKQSLQQIFFSLPNLNVLWLVLSGIMGFLGGNYFSFLNMKQTNEGANSLLSPFITVCSSLLAVVVLHERINTVSIVGLLVTASSVFIYLWQTQFKITTGLPSSAFGSSLICVGCISCSILMAIKGVSGVQINYLGAILIRLLAAMPVALIIVLCKRKLFLPKRFNMQFFAVLFIAVLLQTVLANYYWFIASVNLSVEKFQVLIATLPFFIGFTDAFILRRKKLHFAFYYCAAAALAGVLIFFWKDIF